MKRIVLSILILLALAVPAAAEISPRERMHNPQMEQRAQDLYRAIRCVACQNQSIAESAAPIARDLRGAVRAQIEAGRSDAEIMAYLNERYGDFIFMTPPFAPKTWMLWLAPVFFLAAGGLAARRILRGDKGGHPRGADPA